jgi:hypothetical protein
MPFIEKTGPKAYTVHTSRAFVADLTLAVGQGGAQEISVTHPTATAPTEATLARGADSANLLAIAASGADDTTSVPGRRITAALIPGAASTELFVEVSALANAASEGWQIRVKAPAPVDYKLTTTGTIDRVVCDPAVGLTISPTPGFAAGHTVEGATLTLTAANNSPGTQPTIVGSPAPMVTHTWSYTGTPLLPGLPFCVTQPGLPAPPPTTHVALIAPPVAGNQTATLFVEAWYDGACGSPGFLSAKTPGDTLVVEPRPTFTPNVHSTLGVDTWVRV